METWYVWKFSEERQVSSASSSQKGSPNHAKQNKYFKRSRHWNRWMGPLFRHGFANLVVKVWQVNVWRTCHFLKQKIVLGQVHGVVNSKKLHGPEFRLHSPANGWQSQSEDSKHQHKRWPTKKGLGYIKCGHVSSMCRGNPFRSTLNTGINKVRTCVKYVPRQSIP